jgi:hypothetical protein
VNELLLLEEEELAGQLARDNSEVLAIQVAAGEASDGMSLSSSDSTSVVWLLGLVLDCFFEDAVRVFVARHVFVFVTVGSPFGSDCKALAFSSSQRSTRMLLIWLRQNSLAAVAL